MFFFLLLLVSQASADVEVMGGGLTYHLMNPSNVSNSYSNKVLNDGRLIANPMLGLTLVNDNGHTFSSYTGFTGEDSVGSSMLGGLYETGYDVGPIQLGIALGVYAQDDSEFVSKGVNPYQAVQIGNIGLVPIGGAAMNCKVPLTDSTYLKVNNLISPIITNTSLSYGWKL